MIGVNMAKKEETKTAEKKSVCDCGCDCGCKGKHYRHHQAAGGGAVYGFGLIGALVYFLQGANTFGLVAMGILKALVWPAMIVYYLLRTLGL